MIGFDAWFTSLVLGLSPRSAYLESPRCGLVIDRDHPMRASDTLITKGDSIGARFIPAHDLWRGHFPVLCSSEPRIPGVLGHPGRRCIGIEVARDAAHLHNVRPSQRINVGPDAQHLARIMEAARLAEVRGLVARAMAVGPFDA